jgi:hypothetical protein
MIKVINFEITEVENAADQTLGPKGHGTETRGSRMGSGKDL